MYIELSRKKMGASFKVIGFDRVSSDDGVAALRKFAFDQGTPVEVYQCRSGALVVLANDTLYDSSSIACELSRCLSASVIVLTYDEDAIWGYELFANGRLIDRYSSYPNNWPLPDGLEESDFAGSASTIEDNWTGVRQEQIALYLTNKEHLPKNKLQERAYSDDEFKACDPWQMCDFMKKLGLDYPINENGEVTQHLIASFVISTGKGRAMKADADAKIRTILDLP